MTKMESLAALHRSMRQIGEELQKFRVTTGAAEFECLFSTRDTPYSLALTSRGVDPKFFLFDVLPGYFVKDHFGAKYGDMLKVLRIDGRSGEPLKPANWFSQLDQAIPRQAQAVNVPRIDEILRLRPDIEEADRPFFDTWVNQPENRGPTKENLAKTLLLLGKVAQEHSLRNRLSSRWSATETGRVWRR